MRGACAIRGVDSGLLSVAILGAVGLFFAAFPSLGSRLFANDPAVLESAKINLVWSGLAYAFYGLGLMPIFRVTRKVLGPTLAGTVRLLVVIAFGVWLASWSAPQRTMVVVVALSMVTYGLCTAGFIW
jgi:Na+-driven multidrug efflux pump